MEFRIGHGYDIHRFAAADSPSGTVNLVLGGVGIPHDRKLIAHSDGDVVIHALCDAILGALGEGDIGQHFPDSDPSYRGIASTVLLEHVVGLARQQGWRVGNSDLTVLAETPRLAPHRDAMCARLAEVLATTREQINLKATTTEGLGAIGRCEGIACHAVVLLARNG